MKRSLFMQFVMLCFSALVLSGCKVEDFQGVLQSLTPGTPTVYSSNNQYGGGQSSGVVSPIPSWMQNQIRSASGQYEVTRIENEYQHALNTNTAGNSFRVIYTRLRDGPAVIDLRISQTQYVGQGSMQCRSMFEIISVNRRAISSKERSACREYSNPWTIADS